MPLQATASRQARGDAGRTRSAMRDAAPRQAGAIVIAHSMRMPMTAAVIASPAAITSPAGWSTSPAMSPAARPTSRNSREFRTNATICQVACSSTRVSGSTQSCCRWPSQMPAATAARMPDPWTASAAT